MVQGLVKVLMLLMSINILLYTAGVRVVGSDNKDFINEFINTSSLEAGRVSVATGYREVLPDTLEESGSDFLDFIDSLSAIKKFIFFMVNIIFTPLGLFISAGMPQIIVLMVGMPLMFSAVLGMAYFIRSGS